MEYAKISILKQPNTSKYNDLGLYQGTIFDDLYSSYKYNNSKPVSYDKKENLFLNLLELNFSILDLNLYILTHPNDKEANKKMSAYINDYLRLKIYYEKNYGALCIYSQFYPMENREVNLCGTT